ncbi:MAG: hypothetical protein ACLQUY_11095 [Ktedonobacterales bacterium]
MDKWEYKVLHGLSEDELNKWGDEGYEIYTILAPQPSEHAMQYNPDYFDMLRTVVLKRRKPAAY